MEQALHAGPQVDEGAELAHGGHVPSQHRADDDRSPELDGAGPLLLHEERAPRDDKVLAALLVLGDPERVDEPFVLRRVRGPDGVDLRQGAESALTGDAYLVSALHHPFDLTVHRKTGVECVFELPHRRRAARQLSGERQSSPRRYHDGLDAVADGGFENTLGVLQFVDLDHGLALAADVDERHLRADCDDRALDGLTPLEALRLKRSLEHRCEIFIRLVHGALLVMVTLRRVF